MRQDFGKYARNMQIKYSTVEGDDRKWELAPALGRAIKSLRYFLDKHEKSSYGIRFSTQNYSVHEAVYSYPLYAIASVLGNEPLDIRQAIARLL